MLSWHFNFNDIDSRFTEAVAQDELDLDRTWDGEHVHLEDLLHRKVEVGPGDRHLVRLRYLSIIDEQDGVHLHLFNLGLTGSLRARQLLIRRDSIVILQI